MKEKNLKTNIKNKMLTKIMKMLIREDLMTPQAKYMSIAKMISQNIDK